VALRRPTARIAGLCETFRPIWSSSGNNTGCPENGWPLPNTADNWCAGFFVSTSSNAHRDFPKDGCDSKDAGQMEMKSPPGPNLHTGPNCLCVPFSIWFNPIQYSIGNTPTKAPAKNCIKIRELKKFSATSFAAFAIAII
jgi:hypothetical protein